MAERRGWRPWTREAPTPTRPPPPPAPQPSGVPVALRQPTVPHHWLTVVVARPGPDAPLPIAQARVAVRTFARGAQAPGDVVARGTSGVDGAIALFLPAGRYAVTASDGHDTKTATLTLGHAGRAVLVLPGTAPRVALTVEAFAADGAPAAGAQVDVRIARSGAPAARGVTDARGVAAIPLPPGGYEVRVGDASVTILVEADTHVRVQAAPPPPTAAMTKYAQRARAATSSTAPFDARRVRDEVWN